VSRTSLREALSALSHLGVLKTRGKAKVGSAARARAQILARQAVESVERDLLTHPIEVRRMLEPEVAALAAQRASEEALGEVSEWLRRMGEGVERGQRIVEEDSAFHVAIARATGNPVLAQLVGALTEALRESRELSFQPPAAAATALDDHRAIVAALADRDSARARRAMRRHLDQVERLIRATIEHDA
jgi:GntR family transcriptional repressor for pyruvate dehydrogenase complex